MFQSDLNNGADAKPKSSIHTPSAKHVQSIQDFVSPCRAPREDSHFKENFDVNKSGNAKLNLEPLQMKRKKKGGGYNLRKSLAWDRAFFTEEGVLDPIELSIISGASCGEGLRGINEGTPGSSHKLGNFQEQKTNIRKDFSDEDLCKERRQHCLSPKLDPSSSNTMTSQKIKARFGNKSESSSSGFCRPFHLSPLKRPANVNIGKAVAKEIKLQNVPSSKTGSTPVQTSKSNIPRPSYVNPCQIAQPAFSIRTNGVLKSSSKSLKTTQTTSKTGSLEALICQSEKNSSNSSFKGHSSINMSRIPPAKTDEDSGSKMITANTILFQPVHSFGNSDKSTNPAPSMALHAQDRGLNMHPSQNLIIKPSCLRMPSPSLSFFSQPKASVLHDLSPRGTDTGICGSLKPGSLRLQGTLRTTPKKDNNILTISSSSSAISSRSGCLVPPHVNDASSEIVKSKLEWNSTQMVEMKVLCDAYNSDIIRHNPNEDDALDRQIQDHSKKNGTERISPEEAEEQKIGKGMSSQDASHERVVDQSCDSGWRDPELISECNHNIYGSERESSISEPQKEPSTSICENVTDHRGQNSLAIQEKTCEPNCHELRLDKSEQLYSPAATNNTTSGDGNVLKTKEIAIELLGGSQFGPVSEVQTVCHELYQESQKNDETIDRRWQDELKAVLLHDLSNERFPYDLYKPTPKVEIDYCSSFHVTRTHEVSPKKFLENVTDVVPTVNDKDNDGNSSGTSTMSLEEERTDMDEQSSKSGGNFQVQSRNLNEPCANQSDSVESLNAGRVAETLSHSNGGFDLESLFRKSIASDEFCEDNILGSLVDSLELGEGLKNSTLCMQESAAADRNNGQSSNVDEEPDFSSNKPLQDPTKIEGSEDASSDSINEIQPNLNQLQSKTKLAQNNNHDNGLSAKIQTLVLPQNAVPFSDEWLAAIEAAGDDILTKKGGAVQNSPKTLPDPSPWSPVKRKNNQIGPFDCTKYTNIQPSD